MMHSKDIVNTFKLVKEFVCCSLVQSGSSSYTIQDYIWLRQNESDKRSCWRDKLIGRLLLIVIVADLQQLDKKKELVIYRRVLVEIYN